MIRLDSLVNQVEIKSKDTSKVFFKTLAQTFGVKPYEPDEKPKIAFVRSLFLPGWGQYTNRDYWKMGLVYGAAGAGYYFGAYTNNIRYKRYLGHYSRATLLSRGSVYYEGGGLTTDNVVPASGFEFFLSNDANNSTFYLQDTEGEQYVLVAPDGTTNGFSEDYFYARSTENDDVIGAFSTSTFESAKDQYRRWRDASIIGFAAGWLFFALEANVAAHLKSFDVSDDISWRVTPAGPETFGMHASGVKLAFSFK
ncbi:DUF5683 domain-containing protein [Arcticibacterium luteifluviistationis]|nr:DUF5683 domain-containing protein [Arcticibacterium luteifluviistationis]